MKIKITLFILYSIFFTSCRVITTQTTKTSDIYGSGVVQMPVVVDLDVKETKVSGTSITTGDQTIEEVKSDAVSDALKNANADVLVEPKFTTETTGHSTKVTVTGFPATYKNFRLIKSEDVPLVQIGVIQKANVFEPEKQIKKKKTGIFAGASVLSVIGLIFLIAAII